MKLITYIFNYLARIVAQFRQKKHAPMPLHVAAPRKAGRPKALEGAIQFNIVLTKEQVQKAEKVGAGNRSQGVRKMIDFYQI
jgi:hypothetical protein